MKKGRKLLTAVVCCILMLGLSTMALATVSTNFFVKNVGEKKVTGSGTLTTVYATAKIKAEIIPGKPQQMGEACSSYVSVVACDPNNTIIKSSVNTGNVYASTRIEYTSKASCYKYTYRFGNTELGTYTVDASQAKP